jgi:hypothetical protein
MTKNEKRDNAIRSMKEAFRLSSYLESSLRSMIHSIDRCRVDGEGYTLTECREEMEFLLACLNYRWTGISTDPLVISLFGDCGP